MCVELHEGPAEVSVTALQQLWSIRAVRPQFIWDWSPERQADIMFMGLDESAKDSTVETAAVLAASHCYNGSTKERQHRNQSGE